MISTAEKNVLESLASRKISLETAERLLEEARAGKSQGSGDRVSTPGPLRFLRIAVDEPGKEQVNLKFPVDFLRKGMSLLGVLSPQECQELADRIDREGTGAEEPTLLNTLRSLDFNISPDRNKNVRVFLE